MKVFYRFFFVSVVFVATLCSARNQNLYFFVLSFFSSNVQRNQGIKKLHWKSIQSNHILLFFVFSSETFMLLFYSIFIYQSCIVCCYIYIIMHLMHLNFLYALNHNIKCLHKKNNTNKKFENDMKKRLT